jgi:hypothetical protein
LLLAALASVKSAVPQWIANVTGLTLGTLVVIILAIPVILELVLIIFSMLSEKKNQKIKK